MCGRHTPLPFNSTSNRMKVVFHSNEAIQGDGFRAVWFENCGGIFDVTAHPKVIVSPSYPISYPPNLFCNYTLVAPGKDILVKFMDFQIERSKEEFISLSVIEIDRMLIECFVVRSQGLSLRQRDD